MRDFCLKNPRMACLLFVLRDDVGGGAANYQYFGNPFLHGFARRRFVVKYPSILLSVSQMAEVGFILTIPFFLNAFGIKTVMLMVCWRGCVSASLPLAIHPRLALLLLLSMIVYGCV